MKLVHNKEASVSNIKSKAYRLLAIRSRSCKELKTLLLKSYPDENKVAEVINDLKNNRYLDDDMTAYQWASFLVESGKYGRYGVYRKLFERGILDDTAWDAVEKAYQGIDEKETAIVLIEKKFPGFIGFDEKEKRRLSSYLQRHGFSSEVIRSIFRETDFC